MPFFIAGFMAFSGLEAAHIDLIQKEDNIYYMEVSEYYVGDTYASLLKDIAIKVKRKGYTIFCIPPADRFISDNSCRIIVGKADSEEIQERVESYGYTFWRVDEVLR